MRNMTLRDDHPYRQTLFSRALRQQNILCNCQKKQRTAARSIALRCGSPFIARRACQPGNLPPDKAAAPIPAACGPKTNRVESIGFRARANRVPFPAAALAETPGQDTPHLRRPGNRRHGLVPEPKTRPHASIPKPASGLAVAAFVLRIGQMSAA